MNNAVDPRSVASAGFAGWLVKVVGLFLLTLVTVTGAAGAPQAELPAWQAPGILKNINLQTEDSDFTPPVEMGSNLYFLAYSQGLIRNGYEMWRTDGTPAGTIRLEAYTEWYPGEFHVLGDQILFVAHDPDAGDGLWITDGSPGNAHPIGGDLPSPEGDALAELTVAGDYLYYMAYDDVHLTELWRTDGTVAGTIRLTGEDLNFDAGTLQNLTGFNDSLFFLISDDEYNIYLMKSDGSIADTQAVTQIGDEPINFSISEFHRVGNLLYFTVALDLWRTDGTAAGTYRLRSLPQADSIDLIIGGDSILYVIFHNSLTSKNELWKSAGTAGTTVKVADIPQYYNASATVGDRLFVAGNDNTYGVELWTSDGTATGTKLVKDIYTGDGGSGIESIIPIGNRVFFGADENSDSYMRRLWRSDGTAAGTAPVPLGLPADFNPEAEAIAEFNGRLFAQIGDSTHGREPWMIDPDKGTATFLVDLNQIDALSSMPRNFYVANDRLIFRAGGVLWGSDGSAAGTSLLYQEIYDRRQIRQGADDFAVVGKHLYFLIDDELNRDVEVWRTDGTAAGTVLVKDAIASTLDNGPVNSMADVNGALYFARFAQDRPGTELWRSDGTPGGTVYVATPFPAAYQQSSEIDEITGVGHIAYFVATNGVNGVELWRSDGTGAGTRMVKDIRPGAEGSAPSNLTAVGSRVFFFADDGVHGRELWRSDGTPGGTVMVKDIKPGAASSAPADLTALMGAAYFSADNGSSGRELWGSDGTTAGTTIVKDIMPTGGSNPRQLTTSDKWLYFFAGDEASLNPYRSDGTAAGTTRMAVVDYGDFELPTSLTAVGDWVFFLINDRLYQVEGTTGGAIAQGDAYPEFQAFDIANLTAGTERLYFSAHHLLYGDEPFVKQLSLFKTSPSTLYVSEGDAYSYFRLQFSVKPAGPVTVHFAASDTTVEINPPTVTFTPQNWQIPAGIGVRASDDGQPGVRQATLTMTFESADSSIDGMTAEMPLHIGWRFGYVPLTLR